ncbi:glycosyltransferase family 4 protein [Nocardioides convexus]|uniref:glycosyltransferase family 4 protein n=1 Tax=Nocardioides convexus TaxID=2712224 RepID=UPI0031016173
MHTVYNGVGGEFLADCPRPASAGGELDALWLGLMEPVKRVPDLVAATARLPQVRLTLVGDGPERERVEAAVAAAGSAERVSFAGFQADPAPYLRAADVFVLCSAAEACPMALLQAMACGTPVVATRVGGVPEIVRHGVDGFLVDPGQPEQIRSALGWLAADLPLRRAMSVSARRRVLERFGAERMVEDLLGVYARTTACAS